MTHPRIDPFRTLFEQMPDPAWIIRGHHFIAANAAARRAIGYEDRENFLKLHPAAVSPEFQPDGEASLTKAERMIDILARQPVHRFEWLHQRRDGSLFSVEVTLARIEWEGEPAIYCTWRDMTERQQILKRLKLAEARFQAFFDGTQDAIMLLSREGFLDCNHAALALFGFSVRDDLLSCHPSEVSPVYQPDGRGSRAAADAYIAEAMAQGHCRFEWWHRKQNGAIFPAEVLLSAVRMGDREIMQATVRDISDRKQAEIQLQATLDRLQRVSMLSTDILYSCRSVNGGAFALDWLMGALERVTGYTAGALMDRGCWKCLVLDEDRPLFNAHVVGLKPAATGFCELRIQRRDGATIWLASHAECVSSSRQAGVHVLYGALTDITQRKQAEQALRERETQLRFITNHIPVGIAQCDSKKRLKFVNQPYTELMGLRPGPIIGRPVSEVLGKTAYARVQPYLDIVHTGQPVEYELEVPAQERHRTLYISSNPELAPDGCVIGVISTLQDITARSQAESRLKQSEERYSQLVDRLPVGLYTLRQHTDGALQFLFLSDRCCALTGIVREAVMQDAALANAALLPEDRDRMAEANRQAFATGELFSFEGRFLVNGAVRWLRLSSQVTPLPDGACDWNGWVADITTQKEAEIARRKNETLLEKIGEVAHIGGWELDLRTLHVHWTREVYRLHEVPPGQPVPLDMAIRFYAPEARTAIAAAIETALKSGAGWDLELPFVTAKGRRLWVRAQGETESCDGKVIRLYGAFQDITKRRETADRLRKLAFAVEQAAETVIITDTDACIEFANAGFVRDTGYSVDEAIGQNPRFLHSGKTPKATHDALWATLQRGETWQGEFINRRKDGSEYIEWASITPLRQPDGRITHYVAIKQDITERKRTETALLEAQQAAQQAAQHASQAKSEFLANMSHEIRTPMNAILGLAQLLERSELPHEQREMLNKITESSHLLLGIINDILDFSKIEAGHLHLEQRPFALTAVLNRLVGLLEESARRRGLGLTIRKPAALPEPLLGDSLRVAQVLTNLLSNAIKFTEHGEVVVEVSILAATRHGIRLRFEIRDTGIGVAPEALPLLFQPFTQADAGTSRRFGGTGLGLSISKRLVDLMGGAIGAISTPGLGSTFWFELPFAVAGPAPESTALPGRPPGPSLAGLRVLAVDDNRINLFMLERALTLQNASVKLAADGQQALQILKAQPEDFDVVLMDIQMPVMDGLAATRAIRDDPKLAGLPVIALTAGALGEERESAIAAGMNDFLPKPLDLGRLMAVLSAIPRASALEETQQRGMDQSD